ncbi:SPOR domain-containing protein [Alcanivorax sp.]|uniref:SPOR domain-containing protein n=1 Tax=Alcanivorax sp. TaxID=1872427 RepID=UPI0032D94230
MEHDDERFYSGASRGDFLDAMTAHAGLGSVVAIEGDTGSGVSTLLGQAVMALLADMEVVRIDGSEPHDANVVVDALLRHFDIDREDLPQVLRDTLSNGRLVVVVDNSEDVRADALTTMVALKQKLGVRLCYLFGGLPGIVEALKSVDFTVDDVLDLPTLNADDVQDFAWFVAGEELDDDESEQLAHRSEGLPGALLGLLQGSRDTAAAVPLGESMADHGGPDEASLGADDDLNDMQGFSARVNDDEDGEEGDDAAAGASALPANATATPRAVAPWRHGAAVLGLLLVVIILWSVFAGGEDEDAVPDSRELALPVPESVPAEQVAAPGVPEVTPLKPTMEPVARLEDLDAEPEGVDSDEKVATGNVQLTPVTDPVMQSSPAQRQQEVAVAPSPEKPEEAAPSTPEKAQSKPALSQEQEKASADASGYNQAAWLAEVDDSHWFLQITATSQESNARGVLDQLGGKGAYYPAKRNGKTVFLVLAGDYSSRQAALDAKSTLPAKLRSAGPFPRKMADVRDEL